MNQIHKLPEKYSKRALLSSGFTSTQILYTALGVIWFIGTGFYFFNVYVSNVNDSILSQDTPAVTVESPKVVSITSPMGVQGRDSTQEGLNQLVSDIDVQLSQANIAPDAQKRLLLTKAMALGSVRSLGIQQDGILEAANILNSVFDSEVSNTNDDKYKFSAIPLYLSMLHATCYYSGLAESLPTPHREYYDSLLNEEKLPLKQAILLAVDSFADEGNDRRFVSDAALTGHRAFILGLYFYAYGSNTSPDELSTTDREFTLWNKLKALVATDTNILLLTGPNRGEIDPTFRMAFAFDMLNTYAKDDISDELNTEIDAKYENVFALIDANTDINDETSTAVGRILNSIFYLESMHRRYSPEELDIDRVNEVIQIFIDSVSLNIDTRELYSGYFLEGVTEDGMWMPVRTNFIEIAANYPVLVDFFSISFGIDL